MIRRLVDLALRHRAVVIGAACGLAAWGVWALWKTPVDAIPDLSDNQVIVFADWPGRGAQEVEDQVTYPLTTNLEGLAGVQVVRSQSAFGFSMVSVVFADDVDLYFARARVLERLNLVARQMPDGVVPVLGPDATGVGHVFWYTLESDRLSLRDLRTLQDWFVRSQLDAVPGVAEVASVGGRVEQYQVDVNPDRLRQYGLTLGDVVRAVGASNTNVGGNVIESAGTWSIVRGLGLVASPGDLERIALRASGGTPVFVKDVATVEIGDAFRASALVDGGKEAVGGVVVARAGANAREVIQAVKSRIAQITPALPAGVRLVPFYDRSQLIDRAIDTLRLTLIEEILLVALAHLIFLRHVRSIVVVTLPLPLAVLASFLLMRGFGVTSNIMSLAGIAIAIGVLVDAAIVVTENAFRTIELRRLDPGDRPATFRAVADSVQFVARPLVYSLAIILLAFFPVFTLTGREGKLFHPLAFTKTFAVFSATVLAVTLVPVLCTYLLGGGVHREEENVVMRWLRRAYAPVLDFSLRRPVVVLTIAAGLFAGAVALARGIGSEFMPPLDEGQMLFMPVTDPSVSVEENTEIAKRQNLALLRIPEVASAVAKVGRADTSTDPSPPNMTETIVSFKPRDEWRPGVTPETLRTEMARVVELPGVTSVWTMPIINRIEMLTTGVRSELGLKLHGPDLAALETTAEQVAGVLRTVRGASNVYPEALTGAQFLDVAIDRDAAARYGASVEDVQQVVSTAIGESTATTLFEGRRRVPVRVRYQSLFRNSPKAIAHALVGTPAGPVPLSALARIAPATGPAMIPSENGLFVVSVLLNVLGRDTGGFVDDASAALARRVTLPAGVYVEWSGQYASQVHAQTRLLIVIPLVVGVILVLLYFTYHSWFEAAHVLLAVPFAFTGGLYLLWLSGYNFSVAVWVGFIALFGTATQTGMLMVLYLQEALDQAIADAGGALTDRQLRQAVIAGALLRLRPKVMTTATVIASLVPIFLTSRAGADVLRPLATPVLGGMASSLLHVLVITPVLFFALHRRRVVQRREAAVTRAAHRPNRWRGWVVGVIVVLAALAGWSYVRAHGRLDRPAAAEGAVLRTVSAPGMTIVVRGSPGPPRVGRSRIVVEFRDPNTGAPIDAGDLAATGSMAMPGMTMTAALTAERLPAPGQYQIEGEYGMAGTWRVDVSWAGRGGGRTTFALEVQ